MTLRAWLLGSSLALNGACLAVFVLQPAMAPAAVRPFFVQHFQRAPERSRPAPLPAAARPVQRRPLWSALDTGGDLTALLGRLRSAGFPPEIIRAMVMAEIGARYDARIRAFFEPDPNTPFWQLSANMFSAGDKRMETYSALQRERAKLQRDLFADPFFATDDITAAQRRQFGDLSKQKIDVLQRIEDDYTEMSAAIRSGTGGIILAEDRQKLELLQRERRADLAAVLTPQELADYELRSSPLTNLLVRQLGGFNPAEAEFRAIFQAHQAYSDRMAPNAHGGGNYEERQAAYQKLNEQLKAGLGDARYADYMRETDRNYQQLARIAERENISKDTVLRAYNVRDIVARESNLIADDPALTVDQKRAALQSLGERTRAEILGMLGPKAGPAYVKVVEQSFLNAVQRGNAVSFNNSSSGSMTMSMGGSGSLGLPVTVAFGAGATYRSVGPPRQPPPPPGR